MKKLLLITLSVMLLLSGCMATSTEVIFNDDKTIDVAILYEIMKNDGATEEALQSIIDSASEELERNELDFSVSNDPDAYRINISLRFDSVGEMTSSTYFNPLRFVPQFTSTEEAGKITINLTDDGDLTLSGVLSSEAMGIDAFFSQAGVDLSNITVSFSVVTPDDKNGKWELTGAGETNVEFSAENIYGEGSAAASARVPLLVAIVGVVILAALLAVFITLRKSLKKIEALDASKEEAEGGEGEE